MTGEEKTRLFIEYSKVADVTLKQQAQDLLLCEKKSRTKQTVLSICQYPKKLTQKQKNYLILFIIDHWNRV